MKQPHLDVDRILDSVISGTPVHQVVLESMISVRDHVRLNPKYGELRISDQYVRRLVTSLSTIESPIAKDVLRIFTESGLDKLVMQLIGGLKNNDSNSESKSSSRMRMDSAGVRNDSEDWFESVFDSVTGQLTAESAVEIVHNLLHQNEDRKNDIPNLVDQPVYAESLVNLDASLGRALPDLHFVITSIPGTMIERQILADLFVTLSDAKRDLSALASTATQNPTDPVYAEALLYYSSLLHEVLLALGTDPTFDSEGGIGPYMSLGGPLTDSTDKKVLEFKVGDKVKTIDGKTPVKLVGTVVDITSSGQIKVKNDRGMRATGNVGTFDASSLELDEADWLQGMKDFAFGSGTLSKLAGGSTSSTTKTPVTGSPTAPNPGYGGKSIADLAKDSAAAQGRGSSTSTTPKPTPATPPKKESRDEASDLFFRIDQFMAEVNS